MNHSLPLIIVNGIFLVIIFVVYFRQRRQHPEAPASRTPWYAWLVVYLLGAGLIFWPYDHTSFQNYITYSLTWRLAFLAALTVLFGIGYLINRLFHHLFHF
ncbi:hypothetical protein [Schleiferilactobacillus shenzhenensis]|uniref:Uncharacterized protein n=1 Tax=Schleiferilactobacillus shenzhenensis LY-73 TaxID=1231336 RepID=U4TSD7_9LACO|nr:hypothetical protein [Schleiferilactobacillus shenzhenensis]ERL64397.1 hypothetical protein L248_0939 [Schleiferilactobacillus shenzhenensis LY-73]